MSKQGEKAMTLRLSRMQMLAVEAIARAEVKTKSEVVREAIVNYISARKKDPVFQERLRERLDENSAALKHLSGGTDHE